MSGLCITLFKFSGLLQDPFGKAKLAMQGIPRFASDLKEIPRKPCGGQGVYGVPATITGLRPGR